MKAGFTLIEILVVLSVVAILVAISIPNVMRSMQYQRVNAATQQVVSSVNEVRSQVRRKNVCYSMTFGNTSTFLISEFSNRDCSGTAVNTSTVSLPSGTVLKNMSNPASKSLASQSINFITPYGQNGSGIPLDLTFGVPNRTDLSRNLRITGVLGTVILK